MIELVLKLGGIQAFILGALFLFKNANSISNYLLSFLLVVIGLSCFAHSLDSTDFYIQFPHLIGVNWGIPLLFGPLIYLYTLFLLKPKHRFSFHILKGFLPFLIHLVVLGPFLLKRAEEKIQFLEYYTGIAPENIGFYANYYSFLQFAIVLTGTYFCFKSKQLLQQQIERFPSGNNATKQKELRWLKRLIWVFWGLFVLLGLIVAFSFSDFYSYLDYEVVFYLGLFDVIYLFTFKALRPSPLLVATDYLSNIKRPNADVASLTERSRITKGQIEALEVYMQQEKPYLNGNFTALELAKALGLSRHQLSELLNAEIGKNFYEYVNYYRIEAFKKALADPKNSHLTLLALAMECGFNSKSSFNTIFKKSTGLTPSQYKKQLETEQ